MVRQSQHFPAFSLYFKACFFLIFTLNASCLAPIIYSSGKPYFSSRMETASLFTFSIFPPFVVYPFGMESPNNVIFPNSFTFSSALSVNVTAVVDVKNTEAVFAAVAGDGAACARFVNVFESAIFKRFPRFIQHPLRSRGIR